MTACNRITVFRPNVGAAGRVIQNIQLTAHRVPVDLPTLILVEQGQKTVRWSAGECIARPRDAIALEAGQTIDITNAPDRNRSYGARWISWGVEVITAFSPAAPPVVPFSVATLLPGLQNEFISAYHAAFESLLDVEGVPPSVADHRLREVLVWLRERGVCFSPLRPATFSLGLRRLLIQNPAHDWSIKEIGRLAGVSPATLRRRLAAESLTFRDLLQDIRMSHALLLLQNTDTPIVSIALAVGYDSASRFSARFKSRFAFLPSDVRGQKRGPQPSDRDAISD
jgi:AraC-like DNA-binding protein